MTARRLAVRAGGAREVFTRFIANGGPGERSSERKSLKIAFARSGDRNEVGAPPLTPALTVRARPRSPNTPRAVLRMEASPGDWRRARLRSPTRPPAVSARLWRHLTTLSEIYRERRDGPDAGTDTIAPGAADTIPPGKKQTPPAGR